MNLAEQLKLWGPQGTATCLSLTEAQAYCRALANSHYENFSVVSWLFPRHLRQHLCNVYAYCRWADDLADETNEPEESLRLLNWWEEQLNDLQHDERQPKHPVFIALAETIREKEVPLQPFRDLLVAFRQDQTKTRYETYEELLEYCRHSADPVGQIVIYLGGPHGHADFEYSHYICTGLQLINFCQDVARDYAKGRIYLPRNEREWLFCSDQRFAEQAAMKSAPDAQFRAMLEMQVYRAEGLLHCGAPLSRKCAPQLAFPIRTFVRGGLAIAAAIRQQKFDVWTRRPVISKWRKAEILLQAWLGR